jgi:cell division protein ZapE
VPGRLADRDPRPDPQRLLDDLVPPPHFAGVSFDGYRPDLGEPSQVAALERLRGFAGELTAGVQPIGRRRLLRRAPRRPDGPPGVYLDGGFGVGKTHLLASLYKLVPAPKTFGTFVELTHLVGALGFGQAVERLSTRRLLCIDEFELDDPGDTVLMSTLLARLVEAGVRVAATSNTLPDALGEGRFAAEDFLREIQALSDRFEVVRIDGEDYRHRGLARAPDPVTDEQARAWARSAPGRTCDDFDGLCAHLATVHPSRYGAMVDGLRGVALTRLHQVSDQNVALRLVVLADRFYDRDLPVVVSGGRLEDLFTPDLLRGGYRKKYLRTLSRLTALAREPDAGRELD